LDECFLDGVLMDDGGVLVMLGLGVLVEFGLGLEL
jgi:hypothetical protein